MKWQRWFGMAVVAAVVLVGCGSESSEVTTSAADVTEAPATTGAPETTVEDATETTVEDVSEPEGEDGGVPDENEDLADMTSATFTNPLVIDNPYLPLTPGTKWVFEGITVEDGEEIDHRVELHVTDLKKTIDGIDSVVMWDLDFSDGELVEAELAFFAQDDAGNVWHMGEYPEEYEDGEIIDNPSWFSGLEDALAGYQMMAQHEEGTPSYSQGWGPEVEWTDRGQVDAVGIEVCAEDDCYADSLVIAEWVLEERDDGVQLKSYAPGVGNVKVGFRGDDATQEELNLVERVTLDEAALASVRESALELEASGYENSEVYALTEPLTAAGG